MTILQRCVLLAALLWGAVGTAACRQPPPASTGIRVQTLFDRLGAATALDQLEFSLLRRDDQTPLLDALRRPEPPRRLANGPTFTIFVPAALSGEPLRLVVGGNAAGVRVGTGEAVVTTAAGQVVEVAVELLPLGAVKLPNGRACSAAVECASQFCVDGICCDSACGGSCRSCKVPGQNGRCSFVPAGDQHGACAAPGTCDEGAVVGILACDGAGSCVSTTEVCAPFACDPDGARPACRTVCEAASGCAFGRECKTGSCGKKFDGAACGAAGECSSGFCIDGVCCKSACDGPCRSCRQPGALGTCRAAPPGSQDLRGVCRDEGAAKCGPNGTCDGKGGCALHPPETVCVAATCAPLGAARPTNVQNAAKCDGAGACVPGAVSPCFPWACAGGACTETCRSNDDCASTAVCDTKTGSCGQKSLGASCTGAAECDSGFCVDGVCCNGACAGPCRSCTIGASPGICTTVGAGLPDPRRGCLDGGQQKCGTNGLCDGAGACSRYAAGTICGASGCDPATKDKVQPPTCDGNGACVAGSKVSCEGYVCTGGTCPAGCSSDANCVAPKVCYRGSCTTKPLGVACTRSSECASGHCFDGVCCQSSACGSCRACNVPGSAGTCTAVASGAPDPRGQCPTEAPCGYDGACNGAGACRRHGPGTVCTAERCHGDGVTLQLASACDGRGTCVPGAVKPCGAYVCDASAASCKVTCTSDTDCAAGTSCKSGSCGMYKALGQACGSAAECGTGAFCVDGVCCASSSCASCTSCAVGNGICAAVPAGGVDPLGLCPPDAVNGCQRDGTCDGGGGCRMYQAGTVCASGSCAGSTATPPSRCDGQGACVAPGSVVQCTTFACAAGACLTSCGGDGDCIPPNVCVNGNCQRKPLGRTCSGGAECSSGSCTDGVCCETSACGVCEACNLAGSAGVCAAKAIDAVDAGCIASAASTCGRNGRCDGAGGCRNWPAGTQCAAPNCPTETTSHKASTCDGAGMCVDRGTETCGAYRCDNDTGLCRRSCSKSMECAPGGSCLESASTCLP